MVFKLLFPLIAVMMFLSSCSPIYKTDYSFGPPPSPQGNMCASSCVDKMQLCKSNCKVQEASCREIGALQAENDYLRYVEEQRNQKKPIEKDRSDFSSYNGCSSKLSSCQKQCDHAHRVCHSSCGGEIVERKYCTAFCD